MTALLDGLVAVLVVAGAAFALLGSIGLARFRDFYSRLHGPSQASTLGLGCLLLAVLVQTAREGSLSLHEVLFALFVVLTTPVSAHLLARAARHRGLPTGGRMERPTPDDTKRDGRDARPPGEQRRERDRELDEDLKDTFPASDPVPPKHVD